MTKPTVTDAMVSVAKHAYFNPWPEPRPMRAAITAAIEASGLVEENARLRGIIEHAHDTSRHFMGIHKNTAKYFLYICDILKPHVEDTTNDQ
jgi:hypothetical protein